MANGQRLRTVKTRIRIINRFLPVLKRVLVLLRQEIRVQRDIVIELESSVQTAKQKWQERKSHPLSGIVEMGVDVRMQTHQDEIMGVTIVIVDELTPIVKLDSVIASSSEAISELIKLKFQLVGAASRLRIAQKNLEALENEEMDISIQVNGMEKIQLPRLLEEKARLERAADEENAMIAFVARLIVTLSKTNQATETGGQTWELLA